MLKIKDMNSNNVIRQGDTQPREYQLDTGNLNLNLANKQATIRLMTDDYKGIAYETTAMVSSENKISFSIDDVIPDSKYHLEITVDDYVFPSRALDGRFNVDPSSHGQEANIIQVIGKDEIVRDVKEQVEDGLQPLLGEMTQAELARQEAEAQREETHEKVKDLPEAFQNVIDETTGKDVISAPEIIAARRGKASLGEKIDEVDAQLAQTATKTEVEEGLSKKRNTTPLMLADLHTEVKTAMTGGSVGVVDINSVGEENIKDNAVSIGKLTDELPFIDKTLREFKNPITVTMGSASMLIQNAYEFDMTGYVGQTVEISLKSFFQKTNANFNNIGIFRWDSDGTIENFNPAGAVDIGFVTVTSTDFGENVLPHNLTFSYTVTKSKLFLVFALYQKNPYNSGVKLATSLELLINGVETTPVNSGIGKTYGTSFVPDFFGKLSEYLTAIKPIGSTMLEEKSVETKHLKNVVHLKGKNLFDKAKATEGQYIDNNTGNVIVGSPNPYVYYTSDWMEVEGGKTYIATAGAYSAAYDENKVFIQGFSGSDNPYTMPSNAKYFRISVGQNVLNEFQFEQGTSSTPYEAYYEYSRFDGVTIDYSNVVNAPNITNTNPWYGKTMNIIGDSIVRGLAPTGSYITNESRFSNIVASELGMVLNNYGISSSTISVNSTTPTEREPMVERYVNMVDGADLVIVAGGTNDWMYDWSPLGDMTSRDTTTFYGALHTLCLGLLEKFPKKQLLFLTPIKRSQSPYADPNAVNYNGKTLKEYGDIIKEVCGFYGIPVLDGYSEITINPHIQTQKDLLISDGTHPNEEGHKLIANRLTGYLRQLA